jgi:DNA-binding transcriptional MerR regulator
LSSGPGLRIASVARETALPRGTLRVWERRYGFPTPGATPTANAERLYAPVQVRRLAQIKRLMDRGHRPDKLMNLDESALLALDEARSTAGASPDDQQLDA